VSRQAYTDLCGARARNRSGAHKIPSVVAAVRVSAARRTLGGMAADDAAPPLALVRRARRVNAELAKLYPDAHCELDFRSPLELAVATILSAQCTDQRVNMVTPAVFAKYRTAADYAAADRSELEELIKPTGFFRNKTSSLIAMGQALCERHGGEVPRTLDQLVGLPGIGRKTANVILGNAFDVPGLTVDTHFGRLARRLGWTDELDPVKVESAVARLIPKKEWTILSHRLIWHGRRVCFARKPDCPGCGVARWCPSAGIGGLPAPTRRTTKASAP